MSETTLKIEGGVSHDNKGFVMFTIIDEDTGTANKVVMSLKEAGNVVTKMTEAIISINDDVKED
jgi:hypothetical protein